MATGRGRGAGRHEHRTGADRGDGSTSTSSGSRIRRASLGWTRSCTQKRKTPPDRRDRIVPVPSYLPCRCPQGFPFLSRQGGRPGDRSQQGQFGEGQARLGQQVVWATQIRGIIPKVPNTAGWKETGGYTLGGIPRAARRQHCRGAGSRIRRHTDLHGSHRPHGPEPPRSPFA